MIKAIFDKMNTWMLWVIVAPIGLLISTLSILVFAYAYVVWNSDQVSIEGAWGKITTATTHIQNQNIKALAYNQHLADVANKLNQLLNSIQLNLGQPAHPSAESFIQNKFTSISQSLKQQSELLADQKKELEAVNNDLLQFQKKLNNRLK